MKRYFWVIFSFLIAALTAHAVKVNFTYDKEYWRAAYDMGYEDISKTPLEIVSITIPDEFGKVYKRYNELLRTGGYDLSLYKGKKCTRYTYLIPSLNARANILVYNNEIIGGDISGITLDGIMIPIEKEG